MFCTDPTIPYWYQASFITRTGDEIEFYAHTATDAVAAARDSIESYLQLDRPAEITVRCTHLISEADLAAVLGLDQNWVTVKEARAQLDAVVSDLLARP